MTKGILSTHLQCGCHAPKCKGHKVQPLRKQKYVFIYGFDWFSGSHSLQRKRKVIAETKTHVKYWNYFRPIWRPKNRYHKIEEIIT